MPSSSKASRTRKSLVALSTVLTVLFVVCQSENTTMSTHFKRATNYGDTVKIVKSTIARSALECITICMQTSNCKLVMYQKSTGKCDLESTQTALNSIKGNLDWKAYAIDTK